MVNNENPNNNNNLMSGSMYENNHNSDPLSDNITNISVNSSNSSSMAPNSSRGQMHLSLSQRDCQRRNLPPKLNIMPESDMSISLNSAATDTTRSDASLTPTSPINSQRLFGQPIFDKGNSKNPLPDVCSVGDLNGSHSDLIFFYSTGPQCAQQN